MKTLFFTLLILLAVSCTKDDPKVDVLKLANSTYFKIRSVKCPDLVMSYVMANIDNTSYHLRVDKGVGYCQTCPITLPNGTHTISDFRIFSDNGTPGDLSDDIMIAQIPGLTKNSMEIFNVTSEYTLLTIDADCGK